jgi:hypothetical protein
VTLLTAKHQERQEDGTKGQVVLEQFGDAKNSKKAWGRWRYYRRQLNAKEVLERQGLLVIPNRYRGSLGKPLLVY